MGTPPSLEPVSLQWQDDGELAAQDLFVLLCRLRNTETAEHSNELWRLGHKSPSQAQPSLEPDASSS